MWTRSSSTWAASMARTLRVGARSSTVGGALEPQHPVASYGVQVAGEVDPLLPVPVGDQRLDGEHVLVEQLPGGCAGVDGGLPQHAGADGRVERGEPVDR